MEGRVQDLLAELKAGLATIYGERLRGVYLFGSYARGENRADSDVDVLVVLDKVESSWEEIERTSVLVADCSLGYEVAIGRVFVPHSEWTAGDSMFLNNVREEAVAL